MENGVKWQTVCDTIKTVRSSEILSSDREGTTHYAKGSPGEHIKPSKPINFNDTEMKWHVSQSSCIYEHKRHRYKTCC
jgi:hypothetical protein